MDVEVSLDLKVATQLKALVKGKARCVLPLSPFPRLLADLQRPLSSAKCCASRGLCDLHAVDVRGADLGACWRSLFPGGQAGLPDSVLESYCAC